MSVDTYLAIPVRVSVLYLAPSMSDLSDVGLSPFSNADASMVIVHVSSERHGHTATLS